MLGKNTFQTVIEKASQNQVLKAQDVFGNTLYMIEYDSDRFLVVAKTTPENHTELTQSFRAKHLIEGEIKNISLKELPEIFFEYELF